mmetsp:Transcript_79144/g.220003  ORF Transcript_79144/g.220003 Transcript_79144/m.220003 type:complete len:302 (-) Transcript_79144:910-1815(-)
MRGAPSFNWNRLGCRLERIEGNVRPHGSLAFLGHLGCRGCRTRGPKRGHGGVGSRRRTERSGRILFRRQVGGRRKRRWLPGEACFAHRREHLEASLRAVARRTQYAIFAKGAECNLQELSDVAINSIATRHPQLGNRRWGLFAEVHLLPLLLWRGRDLDHAQAFPTILFRIHFEDEQRPWLRKVRPPALAQPRQPQQLPQELHVRVVAEVNSDRLIVFASLAMRWEDAITRWCSAADSPHQLPKQLGAQVSGGDCVRACEVERHVKKTHQLCDFLLVQAPSSLHSIAILHLERLREPRSYT